MCSNDDDDDDDDDDGDDDTLTPTVRDLYSMSTLVVTVFNAWLIT